MDRYRLFPLSQVKTTGVHRQTDSNLLGKIITFIDCFACIIAPMQLPSFHRLSGLRLFDEFQAIQFMTFFVHFWLLILNGWPSSWYGFLFAHFHSKHTGLTLDPFKVCEYIMNLSHFDFPNDHSTPPSVLPRIDLVKQLWVSILSDHSYFSNIRNWKSKLRHLSFQDQMLRLSGIMPNVIFALSVSASYSSDSMTAP